MLLHTEKYFENIDWIYISHIYTLNLKLLIVLKGLIILRLTIQVSYGIYWYAKLSLTSGKVYDAVLEVDKNLQLLTVLKGLFILSVIHYTICGAVCFQFTNFLCDDWENIYTLSYYHHQIGSRNYYPLFRVR